MSAFFSGTVGPVPAAVLLAVAVVCAITDLWKGKIYNAVTYPAMAIGVVLALAQHGAPGIFYALGGFAVGFFPAFVLFALGGMGGGDVKLLGAIGAIAGAIAATETLILAFIFAVAGAVAGAASGLGGSAGSSFKGASVDRALDNGFGAGTDGPEGAMMRSLRKLIYSRMATVVTLHDEAGALKTHFEADEPIKARVTYLFYCQIPLVNKLAGKAFYNLPDSTVMDLTTGPLGPAAAVGIPGYFMTLTAEHTMTNQGKP